MPLNILKRKRPRWIICTLKSTETKLGMKTSNALKVCNVFPKGISIDTFTTQVNH